VTAVASARAAEAPSGIDRRLRIAILVVSAIGIGIATYLTYVHYAGIKVACLSSGGCETVQSSAYSKLAGIPVAVLGLIGYVLILASLAVRGEIGRIAGFGIALFGFVFSMYLTYREVFTIKAICQWCVGSAVLMTALLVLTSLRVIRGGVAPAAPSAEDPAIPAETPAPEPARPSSRSRDRAQAR
jgi:uncharacterized membrane protein